VGRGIDPPAGATPEERPALTSLYTLLLVDPRLPSVGNVTLWANGSSARHAMRDILPKDTFRSPALRDEGDWPMRSKPVPTSFRPPLSTTKAV